MMTLQNITKYYGSDLILDSVNCEILPGKKIGLIGRNGSGKTTLIRIIVGQDREFDGVIVPSPGLRIGYVAQYIEFSEDQTVEEYLLNHYSEMQRKLRIHEEQLGAVDGPNLEKALEAYQHMRDLYDAESGDELPARGDMLLHAFGLSNIRDHSVATLSGGECNLLSLARTVLARPDLLILDEPGNHLDYEGMDLLEKYLRDYAGAVLIVSHNRYLLDRVVEQVFELEAKHITCYTGNYSGYRMQKLRGLTAQQADYVANQKRLVRLEALVARFAEIARATADPKWGKRLRARRTQLNRERSDAIERPELDRSAIEAQLESGGSKADFALQIKGYSRSIGETLLFTDTGFSLFAGEHAALVGPNGCGKTTFLEDLLSTGTWDDDVLRIGPSMRVAYCAQNHSVFEPEVTVVDAFRRLAPLNRHEVFSILSRYLFGWSDLEKTIGDLSGGELNRLQIARAQVLKANLLILDEPTNHLDIAAREAIEEALDDFDGTILVVSHDRYFLDKVTDRIIAVVDESFVSYSGSFSEYWRDRGESTPTRKLERTKRASPKKRTSVDKSAKLEERIDELEREKGELEREITDAFSHGDHIRGRDRSNKLERLISRLGKLYEEWDDESS